ncbi:hypothetical protein [uncultured Aliiroseovarius sp.]|uniref:hypothetical protein n=1 Tax=uncultured Aliiroseovarius sp. TaxID=1658783 RepID=UPI00260D73DF|nr:hypothetical protein [uncultured Aliiroseovarius sp.]
MENDNFFIAVTQDGYSDAGHKTTAFEIVRSRLGQGLWPVYKHTNNRHAIAQGGLLFFYVGGQGVNGGSVVAKANIDGYVTPRRRLPRELYSASEVEGLVKFRNIVEFSPVPLKPLLIKQGVIREENKKWGAFLMGGFKRIPKAVSEELLA